MTHLAFLLIVKLLAVILLVTFGTNWALNVLDWKIRERRMWRKVKARIKAEQK